MRPFLEHNRPVGRWFGLAVVAAAACLAPGCSRGPQVAPIGYCLPSAAALHSARSIVMVRLNDSGDYPDIARIQTDQLYAALQRKRLFHIDLIDPRDPRWQALSLQPREPFTLQQLADIRQTFGCDAVLVGCIDQFQPYPRMGVGLYLRLVDVRDGRLLWGVDNLWDSTDRQIEKRIERFFTSQMRDGYEPVEWHLALMSPSIFCKFVAYEAASTLPNRPPPPAPGGRIACR